MGPEQSARGRGAGVRSEMSGIPVTQALQDLGLDFRGRGTLRGFRQRSGMSNIHFKEVTLAAMLTVACLGVGAGLGQRQKWTRWLAVVTVIPV